MTSNGTKFVGSAHGHAEVLLYPKRLNKSHLNFLPLGGMFHLVDLILLSIPHSQLREILKIRIPNLDLIQYFKRHI